MPHRPFPLVSRSSVAIAALATCFAVACSAAPSSPSDERAASTSDRIIRGKPSDASQDAVVLLVTLAGAAQYECSGTLLAPNLVLTARHCVTHTAGEGLGCDVNGNGGPTSATTTDFVPGTIFVFTGNQRPADVGSPAAKGFKIINDGAKNLCNHDVALLLLDRKIPNAKIAQIRLDAPAVITDRITAVGWGVTETTTSPPVRMQRNGVKIRALGPKSDPSLLLPVPPNNILVGEAFCQGDSGGPGFAESTGAVIGVVSAGGNGSGNTSVPWGNCVDDGTFSANNLYMRVDPFKDVILAAYQEAGQDPWLEGGPDPRLAHFGDACATGAECQSNICFTDKGSATCTSDCSTAACPDGFDCKSDTGAGTKICKPHVATPAGATTTTTSGCVASPSSNASAGSLAWLGVGAFGIFAAARRRRARR